MAKLLSRQGRQAKQAKQGKQGKHSTVIVSEVPDEVAEAVDRSASEGKQGGRQDGRRAGRRAGRQAGRQGVRQGGRQSGASSARDMAAAYAAGYAAAARDAASRYGGTARDRYAADVAPRVAAARERVSSEVAPKVAAGVASGVATARERAADTLDTGGTVLGDAKSRGRDALLSLRNTVAPPPPPKRSKLSTPLLLLAAASAAVAAWQFWSRRSRSDSWDLPTYTSPSGPGGSSGPALASVPAAPTPADVAGSDPGEARADAALEESMTQTGPSSPDRTPDLVSVPGDAAESTASDDTAATASPAGVRSDEGPGISDTDDAAARARAGDVGRSAFENATGSGGERT